MDCGQRANLTLGYKTVCNNFVWQYGSFYIMQTFFKLLNTYLIRNTQIRLAMSKHKITRLGSYASPTIVI